jgi:single-stranded DNA-binding protein
MNSVNLIGRVGQNPTLTTFTDTDNKVAKFSLAVPDYSSKKENPDPVWVDVECWNALADRVLKNITVGREIAINGRLFINKFIKDVNGVKIEMKRPVVKLTAFDLLGKKPSSEDQEGEVKESATKRKRKTAA